MQITVLSNHVVITKVFVQDVKKVSVKRIVAWFYTFESKEIYKKKKVDIVDKAGLRITKVLIFFSRQESSFLQDIVHLTLFFLVKVEFVAIKNVTVNSRSRSLYMNFVYKFSPMRRYRIAQRSSLNLLSLPPVQISIFLWCIFFIIVYISLSWY